VEPVNGLKKSKAKLHEKNAGGGKNSFRCVGVVVKRTPGRENEETPKKGVRGGIFSLKNMKHDRGKGEVPVSTGDQKERVCSF